MSFVECFPYKPLDDQERHSIAALCGGPPVTDSEGILTFLRYLATPMIKNWQLKQLLISAAANTANTFDIDPARGREVFQKGALLYVGVLAELSPLGEVPCHPDVFRDAANTDTYDAIWQASERLQSEVSSFGLLVGDLEPALGATEPPEQHLLTAGAGLMHVITWDSLRLEASRQLEAEHPELADLEAIFRQLDEP